MNGWTGSILLVDLDRGETGVLRPDRALYAKFLGGRGLAGHFLRPKATLAWDDPETPLLVFTGPLNGTASPTPGRATIMSRSPLTPATACSSVGGRLGRELKNAGWDGLIITGKSARPVGLEIRDREARLVDASMLAGLTTGRIFDRLTASEPKASLAATGPAAENGVLFASIAVDRHHAAGRSGLGLTMAAKGLKYLLILGTGRTEVHDPAMLKQARQDILRLTAASPVLMGGLGLSRYGTPALYDLMHSRRMMPTDNFRHTRFEAAARLNAHALVQRFRPKAAGCAGCHIRCKRVDESGRSLPEFESLSHFTALIGNDDLDAAVAANELCNEYGMDAISAGATLACLLEITGEEVSGARILELLRDTALGRGLGADLGRGSRRLAEYMGWPEKSMSVKGLELPAYDPRGAYGMALALAVATRGGCHLAAYPVSHEILRKPVATDRFSFSGKARMIKIAEDMNAAVDSLPACKFTFFAAGLEEYAKAYTAVTGEPSSAQDLLLAGERVYYNERIMNALNGLTIKDDDLPVRFFEDDGDSGGGVSVKALDRDEFLDARERYCRVRGLDEHGRPTGQTAQRLGLEWND